MSNQQNTNAAGSSVAYDNTAMVDESKEPTVRYSGPPPPYSGPEPASQVPYTIPMSNVEGQCPPYPGPPANGEGPYPPYPAGPVFTNVVLQTTTGPRFACGHCNGQFVFHRTQGLARCPFCHRLSSVGSAIRTRAISYIVVGIICLLLGVGVTVATLVSDVGWYFVWF
uniref:Phosphatidylinositol-4,5-bisphosphate 4-phosphatase n=1 Tax=Plectus sambesii TaxID=2011161 RepID=A0A914VW49_9BILA